MDRISVGLQPELLTSVWLVAYVVARKSNLFGVCTCARVLIMTVLPGGLNNRKSQTRAMNPWLIPCVWRWRRMSAESRELLNVFWRSVICARNRLFGLPKPHRCIGAFFVPEFWYKIPAKKKNRAVTKGFFILTSNKFLSVYQIHMLRNCFDLVGLVL